MSCLPRFWLLLSIYLPRPRLAPYCHPLPPKRNQDGHKITPRWPRYGPRRPQDARDGPEITSRLPQNDPKPAPGGPQNWRLAHARCEFCRIGYAVTDSLSKRAQSGSKTAQNGPRRAKMGPRWPKMARRWSQDGAKKPQNWRLALAKCEFCKVDDAPSIFRSHKP